MERKEEGWGRLGCGRSSTTIYLLTHISPCFLALCMLHVVVLLTYYTYLHNNEMDLCLFDGVASACGGSTHLAPMVVGRVLPAATGSTDVQRRVPLMFSDEFHRCPAMRSTDTGLLLAMSDAFSRRATFRAPLAAYHGSIGQARMCTRLAPAENRLVRGRMAKICRLTKLMVRLQ